MSSGFIRDALARIPVAEPAEGSCRARVAELFEEMRNDVYRYLLTLGLYPPQAQEATQEVFLRLYMTMKRTELDNPRAWVFRVAHNHGLRVRAGQKSVRAFEPEMEQRLESSEESPETALVQRDRMTRFHRAIENLSEQQKRCLFLRMEGLRYPEIAETLGISASAVGEFMRRAIARLRREGL
ncbi:MAG: sigma-70 family RNA polymerase sigma factor [Bryobacteraceae bacterium]